MNATATRTRRSLLVVGALTSSLWLGVTAAAPALAAPAAPAAPARSAAPTGTVGSTGPVDSSRLVPLVVEPALAYLEATVSGYVKDTDGSYYGPYERTTRCSAFTVGSDGDLLTAGHCVDVAPGSELWSLMVTAAVEDAVEVGYTWEDTDVALTAAELREVVSEQWSVEGDQSGSTPELLVTVRLHGEGEALPASVREVTGVADGDTAVLKVNASGLPVLELAADRVAVGADVVSVGYAQVSDQASDPSASPTFRGGEVTSNNRTQEGGKLPVYETSADLMGGMSGGPTVDEQGRVVGINSYSAGGSDAFNYVQPSTIALDLLPRSVDNELSTTDVRFRQGATALVSGRPAEALAAFEEVLETSPGYATAAGLRDQAAKATADVPAPAAGGTVLTSGGAAGAEVASARAAQDVGSSTAGLVVGLLVLVLALALLAAVVVVTVLWRRNRRLVAANAVTSSATAAHSEVPDAVWLPAPPVGTGTPPRS